MITHLRFFVRLYCRAIVFTLAELGEPLVLPSERALATTLGHTGQTVVHCGKRMDLSLNITERPCSRNYADQIDRLPNCRLTLPWDYFPLARHSGITDRRALIRDLPIEGVDFLGAGVAEQKRRVVGGQAEPDIVETCLPEVLQVGHSLDLVIA